MIDLMRKKKAKSDGEPRGAEKRVFSDEGLSSIARERYTVLCRGGEGMRISGYSIRSYNC